MSCRQVVVLSCGERWAPITGCRVVTLHEAKAEEVMEHDGDWDDAERGWIEVEEQLDQVLPPPGTRKEQAAWHLDQALQLLDGDLHGVDVDYLYRIHDDLVDDDGKEKGAAPAEQLYASAYWGENEDHRFPITAEQRKRLLDREDPWTVIEDPQFDAIERQDLDELYVRDPTDRLFGRADHDVILVFSKGKPT